MAISDFARLRFLLGVELANTGDRMSAYIKTDDYASVASTATRALDNFNRKTTEYGYEPAEIERIRRDLTTIQKQAEAKDVVGLRNSLRILLSDVMPASYKSFAIAQQQFEAGVIKWGNEKAEVKYNVGDYIFDRTEPSRVGVIVEAREKPKDGTYTIESRDRHRYLVWSTNARPVKWVRYPTGSTVSLRAWRDEVESAIKRGESPPSAELLTYHEGQPSDLKVAPVAKEITPVTPEVTLPEGIKKLGLSYNIQNKEALKRLVAVEDKATIKIGNYWITVKFSEGTKHYENAGLLSTVEDATTGKIQDVYVRPVFIDKFLSQVKEIKPEVAIPKAESSYLKENTISEEALAYDRELIPFTPAKRLERGLLYVMEEDIPHPIYGYSKYHKEYSVIDLRGYRKGYEPRLDIRGIYTPNPKDVFRLGTGRLPPYQPTTTGDKLQADMERLGVFKAWRIKEEQK